MKGSVISSKVLRARATRRFRFLLAAARAASKLRGDARGAVALEYGFIVALIVIVLIFAVRLLGSTNLDIWTNVSAKVIAAS